MIMIDRIIDIGSGSEASASHRSEKPISVIRPLFSTQKTLVLRMRECGYHHRQSHDRPYVTVPGKTVVVVSSGRSPSGS